VCHGIRHAIVVLLLLASGCTLSSEIAEDATTGEARPAARVGDLSRYGPCDIVRPSLVGDLGGLVSGGYLPDWPVPELIPLPPTTDKTVAALYHGPLDPTGRAVVDPQSVDERVASLSANDVEQFDVMEMICAPGQVTTALGVDVAPVFRPGGSVAVVHDGEPIVGAIDYDFMRKSELLPNECLTLRPGLSEFGRFWVADGYGTCELPLLDASEVPELRCDRLNPALVTSVLFSERVPPVSGSTGCP
jgi:hypothetical protein